MAINFYYFGYVNPATSTYCTWWPFLEYSFNLISELLVTSISIQWYMLIFQINIFHSGFKRCTLYYVPLALCFIYPIIFYMIIIVLYPLDDTQWDFTSNLCGYANFYLVYNKVLSTIDCLVNNVSSIVVIILTNVSLVIRVNKRKYR
ncbi:unnamed protein product [Rotaria sp. Silwood1]|nr:unnamed protein product [Rotaria sp. Silwood1]